MCRLHTHSICILYYTHESNLILQFLCNADVSKYQLNKILLPSVCVVCLSAPKRRKTLDSSPFRVPFHPPGRSLAGGPRRRQPATKGYRRAKPDLTWPSWRQGFFYRQEPDPFRYRSVSNQPNSKFKFKLKNKKIQKISKNTLSCDESNGVNFFSNIRSFSLLYEHLELNKKTDIQKYTNII